MNKQNLIIIALLVFFGSCNSSQPNHNGLDRQTAKKVRKYHPEKHFSPTELDSLMVDMATYIGVKPKTATTFTRFEPAFRNYYTQYSKQFQLLYYHIDPAGYHFYYLLRPARGLSGNQRGVGGRLQMQEGAITQFEEILNTPVLPTSNLKSIGAKLFLELVATGNVDQSLQNKEYIEWPDHRLKYHKEKFEWRYDVE
jgi:hypothetical protein